MFNLGNRLGYPPQIMLRWQDLGSFRYDYPLYWKWMRGLAVECRSQGKLMLSQEKTVLPKTMFDPRSTEADIAKGQLWFINNCVLPMFQAWSVVRVHLFPLFHGSRTISSVVGCCFCGLRQT